jgi:uncharacterized protein YecT (DUF1311 family)
MRHRIPSLHLLPPVRAPFVLVVGMILTVLQGHPSFAAGARKTEGAAAVKPNIKCDKAPTAIDRLICLEPDLAALDAVLGPAFRDYQDRAAQPAERDARATEQRLWLDGRALACPAAAQPQPPAAGEGVGSEGAVACLSGIYEQRLAVLGYERNAAAWPRIRFRPTIIEGAGTKLCDDLERDLTASFLGRGLFVNPLGEREIGFVPVPGLGHSPVVRRADIDAYNLGKPFPILQWIEDHDGGGLATAEYRAFDSPKELLNAIGRGVEPLAQSVRQAAHPVIDIDRLPRPESTNRQTRPRAAFARSGSLSIDEMPRFFRYEGQVYLAGPMQPVAGKPGDFGIYRLYGAARLHRVCLFDAHMQMAHLPDHALSLREIATLERTAGPLLPTGRLCAGIGDEARSLADHAAWRPWVLDWHQSIPGGLSGDQLALYMRNRALTGPEKTRQYGVYIAARAAAVDALAPFYRDEFGRTPAEAKRLAALYLDRKIADGFELDPDDDAAAALLSPDYAGKHAAQQAALDGDTAALREALGPEPRAVAKGIKGDLDEPLVSDALEHCETLRAVLELGLDPNEVGASGRTPLMMAARLDRVEAAGILLEHGATPDGQAKDAVAQTDGTGDPLCMTGDKAAGDTPGRTALSYAAELGSPEMVRLLLDHGADATRSDSVGRRASDYVKNRTGDPAQAAKIAEMLK